MKKILYQGKDFGYYFAADKLIRSSFDAEAVLDGGLSRSDAYHLSNGVTLRSSTHTHYIDGHSNSDTDNYSLVAFGTEESIGEVEKILEEAKSKR